MSPDPLTSLVTALRAGRAPPFEWVVEHGHDRDPVASAWAASASPQLVAEVAAYALDAATVFAGLARAVIELMPHSRYAKQTRRILRGHPAALDAEVRRLQLLADGGRKPRPGWASPYVFYELTRGYLNRSARRFGRAAMFAGQATNDRVFVEALRRRLPAPTIATLTEARRVV